MTEETIMEGGGGSMEQYFKSQKIEAPGGAKPVEGGDKGAEGGKRRSVPEFGTEKRRMFKLKKESRSRAQPPETKGSLPPVPKEDSQEEGSRPSGEAPKLTLNPELKTQGTPEAGRSAPKSEEDAAKEAAEAEEKRAFTDSVRAEGEKYGVDPEKFEDPQMKKITEDIWTCTKLAAEPKDKRDPEKWKEAAKSLRDVPKEYQGFIKAALAQNGVDQQDLSQLFPDGLQPAPAGDSGEAGVGAAPLGRRSGVEAAPQEGDDALPAPMQEALDAMKEAHNKGKDDDNEPNKLDVKGLLKKLATAAIVIVVAAYMAWAFAQAKLGDMAGKQQR